MPHQTLSLEKYWKLFSANFIIKTTNDVKWVAMAAKSPNLKALQTPPVVCDLFTFFRIYKTSRDQTVWDDMPKPACTEFIRAVHPAQILELYTRPQPSLSSLEDALLLVNTKNGNLWECPTLKSAIHGLPVTLSMVRVRSDKSDWLRIRKNYSAHAQKIRLSERSRFLKLTKRRVASGDENASTVWNLDNFVRTTYSRARYSKPLEPVKKLLTTLPWSIQKKAKSH